MGTVIIHLKRGIKNPTQNYKPESYLGQIFFLKKCPAVIIVTSWEWAFIKELLTDLLQLGTSVLRFVLFLDMKSICFKNLIHKLSALTC